MKALAAGMVTAMARVGQAEEAVSRLHEKLFTESQKDLPNNGLIAFYETQLVKARETLDRAEQLQNEAEEKHKQVSDKLF